MATTNSTIEKIAPMFTDLLIKKIECLKTDWQKPWIASLEQGLPRNIRGTLYNGGNVLMLLFYTEFMKFTLPVFLTFNQAKEEDLSVCKGARSFPVYYWFKFVVHKETKKTIKYEEYRKLPATEQENYKVIPQMKYYNVFNIDQTDFAEKQPERYERMKKGEQPEDYSDGMIYEALDELVYLQNWYCPIKVQYSDSAYYSPSSDPIYSGGIREQLEDYFYQSLEVDLLLRLCPDDEDTIYQIVDLLVDTCSTKRKMLRIAGDDKPAEVVRSRLKKLNADHIRFVLDSLAENTAPVRNMKQYLLAMLYNAPTTMNLYYQNKTNHDFARGSPKAG